MTQTEALRLALEALEDETSEKYCPAITAIKAALEAKDEPVLWMMPDGKTADKWALQFYGGQKGKPLYTTPPQREWVGLTDNQIQEIVGPYGDTPIKGYTRKLFDQIEAALRSKNT